MPRGSVVALGSHPLARDLVVRLVGNHALPDPIPVHRAVHWAASNPKQLGKPEGPEVVVLWRVQQQIDKLVPLAKVFAGYKLLHSFGRGQGAGEIETDASQKLRIARQLRRQNIELVQL